MNIHCHMPIWVTFRAFIERTLMYGHVKKLRGDECRTNSGVSGSRNEVQRDTNPLDLESSYFDGCDSLTRRRSSRMAIYKLHKGRRLKRSDRDWDKGTWRIEFSLRGNY